MQKADAISHVGLSNHCRQRPTLPHSFPCSTIGGIRLNFRVRDGKGGDPDPMTTRQPWCPGVPPSPPGGASEGKPFSAFPPARRKRGGGGAPRQTLQRTQHYV